MCVRVYGGGEDLRSGDEVPCFIRKYGALIICQSFPIQFSLCLLEKNFIWGALMDKMIRIKKEEFFDPLPWFIFTLLSLT